MEQLYQAGEICGSEATEVKDIMESILADKENLDDVTRVTNILICDFMKNNPDKSINSIDFISHSIKSKPNTKDDVEYREAILTITDGTSTATITLKGYSEKIEQKKNEPCISLSCLNAAFLDKMLTKCLTQRRRWHPTPVLLPGQSHGQRSLVGCSPWGH